MESSELAVEEKKTALADAVRHVELVAGGNAEGKGLGRRGWRTRVRGRMSPLLREHTS